LKAELSKICLLDKKTQPMNYYQIWVRNNADMLMHKTALVGIPVL